MRNQNGEIAQKRGSQQESALLRRLLQGEAERLTDRELVGVLCGVADAAVFDTVATTGLLGLAQMSLEGILSIPALPMRVAAQVTAGLEFARRLQHSPAKGRLRLDSPQAIWAWVVARAAWRSREEFHVLCLNSRHTLLRHARVAVGTADQCHVDPREVLAPAICCRASAIALVHNHPSGECEPSSQDLALTQRLKRAAEIVCIRVLDHLVVSEGGYVSMEERHLL